MNDGLADLPIIDSDQESAQQSHSDSSQEYAERIIRLTAGECPGECHSQAIQLLANRFNDEEKQPKIIPLYRLRNGGKKVATRRKLAVEVSEARGNTFDLLSKTSDDQLSQQPDVLQLFNQLVIKEFVEERLKLKELQQNSDWWKRLNGLAAIGLTIFGPLIGMFMEKYFGKCSEATNPAT